MEKLIAKRKPALLLTIGTAAVLIAGGSVAAWLVGRQSLSGLPVGSEILPQDTAMTISFATQQGQWQQLRRYGTPETQASFDRKLAEWRDRLLTANGLDFQRDVQPWLGNEITVAFLPPPEIANAQSAPQAVLPYQPNPALAQQATVLVLPIANPEKAQQLLSQPKAGPGQEWVDRDYQGLKIREVHGKDQIAYAGTLIDNHLVVVSNDARAIERVIDTYKGKASVAQTPGYGQAFSRLTLAGSFARMFVNVPTATAIAMTNANQPVPPQMLLGLQGNRGLAATINLESEAIRMQGVAWLDANSPIRIEKDDDVERIPNLLPADSVMVMSGKDWKQTWQNYSQQAAKNPRAGLLSPDTLRQGFGNMTGLDLDKDLFNWMNGEFALALISAPGGSNGSPGKAGIVLLAQTTDRKAADQSFDRLDKVMRDTYRFQVNPGEMNKKPVVNWVSPGLTLTRGWLDGNVAFIAIGPGVTSTILPAPSKPLRSNELYRNSSSSDTSSGHFFIQFDRLANAKTDLPFPALPPENRSFLSAIRAIGVTSTVLDSTSTRFDLSVLLRQSNKAPGALPPASP